MDAKEQKKCTTILRFIQIIVDTIQDAGPHGIQSGHLYAAMMHTVDLQTYTYAIDILKESGAVTEQFHLLRWTGKRTIPTI